MADIERLSKVCEDGLEAIGYELVDLEYLRDASGWLLRVYIDARGAAGEPPPASLEGEGELPPLPRSAISHQDCEAASRHLGTVLDVEDLIDTAYRLEVSSPGVRRPLRKEIDFKRFTGHKARVEMNLARDGRKKYTGVIRGAGDGRVKLALDGQEVELPLNEMKKARLEVEL